MYKIALVLAVALALSGQATALFRSNVNAAAERLPHYLAANDGDLFQAVVPRGGRARSLQQERVPTTCTFTNATPGLTLSTCKGNDNFLLYLARNTNLDVNGTVYARNTVGGAKAFQVCNSYNVSTAAGRGACAADSANNCFLSISQGTRLACSTATYDVTGVGLYNCPGSMAYNMDVCMASNRTACQANPECIWSILGRGWRQTLTSAAQAQTYESRFANLTNGASIDYGFCQYRPEFQYATGGSNSTYNATLPTTFADQSYRSTDAATFFEANGNCSAAQAAFKATTYQTLCSSFNTMQLSDTASIGRGLLRSDRPPNVTALQGCIANRCAPTLFYTALYRGTRFEQYLNYTAFYACQYDSGYASSLFYPPGTSDPYYNYEVACNLFANQFDREACLGVPSGL